MGKHVDFDQLPIKQQIAERRADYERRDVGRGTNARFMDDLERMFVTEDCGGDLNFIIYGPDEGHVGFASLNPPEVIRLYEVLRQRVESYRRA